MDTLTAATCPLDEIKYMPHNNCYEVCMLRHHTWKSSNDIVPSSYGCQAFVKDGEKAIGMTMMSKQNVPRAYCSMRRSVMNGAHVNLAQDENQGNVMSMNLPSLGRKFFPAVPNNMKMGCKSAALCKSMNIVV